MRAKEIKNSIDLFDSLLENKSIYVELKTEFISNVRGLIFDKYKTLKNFNSLFLGIDYPNLKHEFNQANYHNFVRWLKIIKDFEIDREELFENVKGFRVSGSHSRNSVFLNRNIKIDEKFVEGYALYIAEGDTGLSGKAIPKKLRFTNANIEVIKFFIDWIKIFFPDNYFYLNVILPPNLSVENNFSEIISKKLGIEIGDVKIKHGKYNKKIKYKVCLGSAIIIDLLLSLDKLVKGLCAKDKSLAVGYIKGIMAGEGTVYFNKSRYVRIEMKNEKEIKYVYSLLKRLKYDCKVSFRKERLGMCSIFIGAKQLEKFYSEIGFGSENERNELLKLAVEKQLKVNQYI